MPPEQPTESYRETLDRLDQEAEDQLKKGVKREDLCIISPQGNPWEAYVTTKVLNERFPLTFDRALLALKDGYTIYSESHPGPLDHLVMTESEGEDGKKFDAITFVHSGKRYDATSEDLLAENWYVLEQEEYYGFHGKVLKNIPHVVYRYAKDGSWETVPGTEYMKRM